MLPGRRCHCQRTRATSSPGEQTGPSRPPKCHCTPAATIPTPQGHSVPALCHPGAHHSTLAVSPPPRDEGKLRQMLQRGARKGRFRLRVPAAAEGNWQPAGEGMEAAEGTGAGGAQRGRWGHRAPRVGKGDRAGSWAKIGGKKQKIKIGACKGFVQSCRPRGWCCTFPGLGDMGQGSGTPAEPHGHHPVPGPLLERSRASMCVQERAPRGLGQGLAA